MTWEPLEHCKDLTALDQYLEVMGTESPQKLPKKPVTGNKEPRSAR